MNSRPASRVRLRFIAEASVQFVILLGPTARPIAHNTMPNVAKSKRSHRILRPRLSSCLGIDIGVSGVKVAEVATRRGRHSWISRAHRRLSKRLDQDVDIADIGKFLASELPNAADGRQRTAVVSLPSHWCLSRPTTMESMDHVGSQMVGELGKNAQWCAWQLPQGNGPQFAMSYGVVGELAEVVAEAVDKAGHRCARIDAHPLALFRSISLAGSECSNPSCILDWGWDSCDLVVCNESGPGLVRCLPKCGLRYLVDDAAQKLECDQASVLRILRYRTSVANSDEHGRRASDQAHDLLFPHTKRISTEISQSLKYARRIGCDAIDGPLILCGGGGSLPAVTQLMSSQLEPRVVRWSWAGQRAFLNSDWTPPDSMFAVALSLACGDLHQ